MFFGFASLDAEAGNKYKEQNLKSVYKESVSISKKIRMCKAEVSNAQYMEFIKKQNAEDSALHRIQAERWRSKAAYNEPYVKYYHDHPAFADYPVVNINQESARAYCQWLTELYNTSSRRKYQKVLIRLPTEDEWTTAAKGGNPNAIYPWEGNSLRTKDSVMRCNFKRAASDTMGIDNAEFKALEQLYFLVTNSVIFPDQYN